MPLAAGDRIGHYEILSLLGKGGMGEVYRGRDTKLKRDIAIKILPETFARDAERMARFQREAEVLASLNHSNIAAIYGVEDRALVMELVEGTSPKGPLPFDQAWKIASQMVAALEYAHDKGIIHRDLKPANIKITSEGMVKLLDFGLAKAFTNRSEARTAASYSPENSPTLTIGATEVGVILGTAAYMPPEQAKGRAVDKRADIWSFGVVFFELLTGERLFQGEDVSDTLAQVLTKEPDLSKVPPKARRLLLRCLEKDPKKRLRDIGEATYLIDDAAFTTPAAPVHQSWLPWCIAAFLVLVLMAATIFHFRETPAPPIVMRFEIPVPDKIAPSRGGILSPDGTKFVFPAVGPNGREIWIRNVDSVDSHALAGTEGTAGTRPFWSPDSRVIAFEAGGKLKKVDIAGGPVQTLCDLPGVLLGGAWTPDGTLILGSIPGPILRVPSGGGVPVPVTKAPIGETSHQFPFLLPDQRSFVYRAGGVGGSVYIGSLDRKPEEQSANAITTSDAAAMYAPSPSHPMHGHLLTLRNGTLLAQPFDAAKLQLEGDPVALTEQVGQYNTDSFVSVSNTGSLLYRRGTVGATKLAWYDQRGTPLSSSNVNFSIGNLVLSPDAARVAIGHSAPNNISILDFARGIDTRITFGDETSPVWSPDGARIAYASGDGIYEKPSNGAGNPERLSLLPVAVALTDWSRDGQYLLYSSRGIRGFSPASSLFVLPLKGDRRPFAFAQNQASARLGRFSPDTRWIAYLSSESGRSELYARPFSGVEITSKNSSPREGEW